MSNTLHGHRTKKTEAPTVGSRGQTTVILCSGADMAKQHPPKFVAVKKTRSPHVDDRSLLLPLKQLVEVS